MNTQQTVSHDYDVVIIGAGPVGIATACTLKALNNNLRICVLEKRPEATRNQALKIQSDAVQKVVSTFKKILEENPQCENSKCIHNLINIFNSWDGKNIQTKIIERDLANEATSMHVKIMRSNHFTVTQDNFEVLLGAKSPVPLSDDELLLRTIFEKAQVVIGADGAHSVVRKAMGDKKADEEVLQHVVQLKYQTDGTVQPRTKTQAFSENVKNGRFDVETMNNKKTQERKLVTMFYFVDQATYSLLRQTNEKGELKGVFGNPWSYAEILQKSEEDEKIKAIFWNLTRHFNGLAARGGKYYEEQISTIELGVYLSEVSVIKMKEKHVLLAGDANAGMILQRGCNKGFFDAVFCAEAVNNYFLSNHKLDSAEIDPEFLNYQDLVRDQYYQEKSWAKVKDFGVNAAQSTIGISNAAVESAAHMKIKSQAKITSLKNASVECSNETFECSNETLISSSNFFVETLTAFISLFSSTSELIKTTTSGHTVEDEMLVEDDAFDSESSFRSLKRKFSKT